MAELSGEERAGGDVEQALRARIAELEALVEARGLTIVGLAAQLAEFQGSPTFARGRLAFQDPSGDLAAWLETTLTAGAARVAAVAPATMHRLQAA